MSFFNTAMFKGRIGIRTYWLKFILPAGLIALVAYFSGFEELYNLSFLWGAFGVAQRQQDTNFKISSLWLIPWFIVLFICGVIAFFLVMGSVSGVGNPDLQEKAMFVMSVPMWPIILYPLLIGFWPGVEGDNEFGAAEKQEDSPPTSNPIPFGLIFRRLFKGLFYLATIMGLGVLMVFMLNKEPPLIAAILNGDEAEVSRLLAEGEDPNQLSREGASALIVSLNSIYRNSISAELLNAGAAPDLRANYYRRADVLERLFGEDSLRETITPLEFAIYHGSPKLVEQMIQQGALDNLTEDRRVLIEKAIYRSNVEILQMLSKGGLNIWKPLEYDLIITGIGIAGIGLAEVIINQADENHLQTMQTIIAELIETNKLRCASQMTEKISLLKKRYNTLAGESTYIINRLSDEVQYKQGKPYETRSKLISKEQAAYMQKDFLVPVKARMRVENPLREGPHRAYKILKVLPKDSLIEVHARTDQVSYGRPWFEVKLNDGRTGYVEGDNINVIGECVEGMR